MPMLLPISASDEASFRPRTASATARICAIYNWHNRLYIRNSRFYSTRTDPNSFANPNLSLHHRPLHSGGRAMSRIRIFLVAAMWLAAAPAMAAEVAMPVKAPWQVPGRPVLRLDRPLCGRSSRLCLGTFELERAARSLEFARPRPVLRYLQRVGELLRRTANRLRLHAAEPRRARRPGRFLVSGLSKSRRRLHRRLLDLLHAGARPGEL